MLAQVTCHNCKQVIRADERYFGKTVACPKCQTRLKIPYPPSRESPADDPLIGKEIAHYHINALIGEGAMGKVYRAKNLNLSKTCALKVLPEHFARQDPSRIERFLREAQAAANVNHENVLPVHFVGRDGEVYFIEMQFVDGGTLQGLLEEQGRLEPEEAARIVRDVASGLAAAHALGIIHRDIKPANVMLTKRGEVKVADFGLARMGEATTTLTMAGVILGTPLYMSPEQGEGKSLDHRSDIYSLGVTFYHLLTGGPPYMADTLAAVLNMHSNFPVPDIREAVPDLSPGLARIVKRMMAKKPEERYQGCEEIVRDLDEFLSSPDEPAETDEALVTPEEDEEEDEQEEIAKILQLAGQKSRRAWYAVAGVVALALVVGGVIFARKSRKSRRTHLPVATPVATAKVTQREDAGLERKGEAKGVDSSEVRTRSAEQKKDVIASGAESAAKQSHQIENRQSKIENVDGVYVTTAATGEKIPHPLSRKTYREILPDGSVAHIPEGMVYVAAGRFIMGDDNDAAANPAHEVDVKAFFIDKYEVTNAQYMEFVKATKHRMPQHIMNNHWEIPKGRENHPVTFVSWDDAKAYCEWAGKRLPTEAEWEKAASWVYERKHKRKYPWGDYEDDNPAKALANWCLRWGWKWGSNEGPDWTKWWEDFLKSERGKEALNLGGATTPVGTFTGGMSPCSCYDMAGNVWEWVEDWFEKYPGNRVFSLKDENDCGRKKRVWRGGSWGSSPRNLRCTWRERSAPGVGQSYIGFRCAADYPWTAKASDTGRSTPDAGKDGKTEGEAPQVSSVKSQVSKEQRSAFPVRDTPDLVAFLTDMKPANDLIDAMKHADARPIVSLYRAKYPDLIETKLRNLERIEALQTRCFERVNSGAATVSMGAVSSRYAYAGDVTRADETGLTAKIKKEWSALTKEEIGNFYEKAIHPESGQDWLGVAAYWMEGNVAESGLNAALAALGTASEKGQDVSAEREYIETLSRLQKEFAGVKSSEDGGTPVKPGTEGYVLLFNGKDLSGWVGETAGYRVENGILVCAGGHRGTILTEQEYGDFIVRFEFRLTPGANNGLAIRAPLTGIAAYEGMEIQIIDNTAVKNINIQPYQLHGAIYGVAGARPAKLRPVGEWNKEEVTARGSRVVVKVNGAEILDADVSKVDPNKTPDGRYHPGIRRDKGRIGFMGLDSQVDFRNIRIKVLDEGAGKTTKGAKEAKKSDQIENRKSTIENYDGVYVAAAATGDKIPHPLSQKTHTKYDHGKKIVVPEGMVYVPAGTFIMGEGQSEHEVHLDAYFIGKYEVTNAEWKAFVAATGFRLPDHWKGGQIPEGKENHPVVNVSCEDTQKYCEWVEKEAGREVRLPTEAEWEKAAGWDLKKGAKARYPWGNRWDRTLCNNGWQLGKLGFKRDGEQEDWGKMWWKEWRDSELGRQILSSGGNTMPVGSFKGVRSPSGCYDTAGNVWEWCKDYLRGGCWADDIGNCAATARGSSSLQGRYAHHGFRLAQSAKPSK